MLIDTHVHLDYPDFAGEIDAILTRAEDAGVTRIITIGTGIASSRRALELAEKYAQVFAVVGVHPTNVEEEETNFIPALRELATHPKVAAIGETGLDYHRLPSETGAQTPPVMTAMQAEVVQDMEASVMDGAYRDAQGAAFRMQLDLAAELDLNVVIHQRDAWDDTLAILKPYTGRLQGVYHCFGNQPDQAAEILALGHKISFTGIVTFKNAALAQAAATDIPSGSFMVETDCPYLAPTPHRGKRCEPAHTRLIAEKIAALRGVSLEDIATETSATAEAFFRLNGGA